MLIEHLKRLACWEISATEPVTISKKESETEKQSSSILSRGGGEVKIAAANPSLTGTASRESSKGEESTSTYRFEYSDKVVFPSVSGTIKTVLQLYDAQLYILLDEWSSLPMDVQPYLAEFIKRAFLPLKNVSVKIASLEYRSDFGMNTDKGLLGFEIGADISAFLDIDDYYVYDRNPEGITDAFADILVRHLANELPEGYLASIGIDTGNKLASKLFTERKVFQELVRAAEGVARDLINIFSKAYFIALRKDKNKIERDAVLEAARQWFEQDKERNLSDGQRIVLRNSLKFAALWRVSVRFVSLSS